MSRIPIHQISGETSEQFVNRVWERGLPRGMTKDDWLWIFRPRQYRGYRIERWHRTSFKTEPHRQILYAATPIPPNNGFCFVSPTYRGVQCQIDKYYLV